MDEKIGNSLADGLRLLVVDDDQEFLKMVRVMLSSCNYRVTTCAKPSSALSILRERTSEFDLLLTDINMPEMTGFELLDIVHAELHLPVILMSVDVNLEMMKKGLKKGACFFLMKPLDVYSVRDLWQFVVSKKYSKRKEIQSLSGEEPQGITIEQVAMEKDEDSHQSKKKNIIWNSNLEEKFLDALRILGKEAIPSQIVKLMNVEGINRHHVSSHLQKHRLRKKRNKQRKPTSNIFPMWLETSMRMDHCNCTPNQLGLLNAQTSYISDPSQIPLVPIPQVAPLEPKIYPNINPYPMANSSCTQPPKFYGNHGAHPNHGASSQRMIYASQGQSASYPINVWNNFGGALKEISQAPKNNDFHIFDSSSDLLTTTFGATDNGLIGEASNGINLTQHNVWDENILMVPEFHKSIFSTANDRMLVSTDQSSSTDSGHQQSGDDVVETYLRMDEEEDEMVMSTDQPLGIDSGQQESDDHAVETYLRMEAKEDFGNLIEKFAYGDDPIAEMIDDDYRFRFNHDSTAAP